MSRNPGAYSTVFCPRLHFSNIGSSVLRKAQTTSCLLSFAFCLLLLLTTYHSSITTMYAQSATATMSGTVLDQNGAVLAGVNVKVINVEQGFQRTITTSDEGTFVVPLLPPGKYMVTA